MRYFLAAVCVAATVGCGDVASSRRSVADELRAGPVTVDRLLAMWETRAGEVRACEGMTVTVLGQRGDAEMNPSPRIACLVAVLSETRPGERVVAECDREDTTPRHASVAATGRLETGRTSVILRGASLERRDR